MVLMASKLLTYMTPKPTVHWISISAVMRSLELEMNTYTIENNRGMPENNK